MATQKIKLFLIICFILPLSSNQLLSQKKTSGPNIAGWEIDVGLYSHSSLFNFSNNEKKDTNLINLEISAPPLLKDIFDTEYLRWRFGATISLSNQTSMIYSGFGVEIKKFIAPFFIRGGLDMAIHNERRRNGTLPLGCKWSFHENADIGISFRKHHRIMATFEHMSNASACSSNAGLTNLGIRYGYRF